MSCFTAETAADGVVTIVLDRPPVNALRFEDLKALLELLEGLQARPDVRAVVITAEGSRAFVAGTDINELAELTEDSAREALEVVQGVVNLIYDFPVPVIAAVNGPAIGSGVAIACASDIRIASPNASFILPEVNVGVMGGSAHVARFIPQGRARWMMYTGEAMPCDEAYRLGLVDAVVDAESLRDEAVRLASEIVSKYPPAIRLAKLGLNASEWLSLRDGYKYECELTVQLRADPEVAEVSRRFLEGRRR
jgi:enoyl-CoA hydratase